MSTEHVAELVRRAQDGDADAFAALYEEYAPQVQRFLARRLHGPADVAEDLTADIFVKVLHKLDRYDDRGQPFAAWLFRLARNHFVDYLRSLPRQGVGSIDEAAELCAPRAEASIVQMIDRHTIEGALARLTPIQREAVSLRFLDGKRVTEVAAIMGRTEDSVKKLQARGLEALRRLLVPVGARAGERGAMLAA